MDLKLEDGNEGDFIAFLVLSTLLNISMECNGEAQMSGFDAVELGERHHRRNLGKASAATQTNERNVINKGDASESTEER
jgi:hypothetical protein